jgi:murein DD-endopeptidase MepM/ murein hydrolase activator NlpD
LNLASKFRIVFVFAVLLSTAKIFADIPATFRSVTNGDTFFSILREEGFSEVQIATALSQVAIPKGLALLVGDIFKVTRDQMLDRTEIKFYPPSLKHGFLFWREGRVAGGEAVELQLKRVIETSAGSLGGSAVESLRVKTGSVWVAQRFMDGYTFDLNKKRIAKQGAKFRLTFEKYFDGAQLVRYGEVIWSTLETEGQTYTRYFKTTRGGGVFVSPDLELDQRPLYSPVDYLRISSLFQLRRFHPIRKRYQAHQGIDFPLPEGSPIYAAYSGVVSVAGYSRAAGNHVTISHPNGMETMYLHLESIPEDLEKGQYIPAGKLLGAVGCTGYCTSPHLHFAVKHQGRLVDPILFVRPYSFRQKGFALQKSAELELLQ